MSTTKIEARRVFEKHGSRKGKLGKRSSEGSRDGNETKSKERKRENTILHAFSRATKAPEKIENSGAWTCKACTFLNSKAEAPVCEICLKSRMDTK